MQVPISACSAPVVIKKPAVILYNNRLNSLSYTTIKTYLNHEILYRYGKSGADP